jgi:aspartate kinase
MSVRCIADFFARQGTPADGHDVWDLGFVTDSNFGSARPVAGWEARCKAAFAALDGERVQVVTGFIGKNERGEVTTVGRNGSDLTATLLGAALGAEEVQIWSDTDGVMSADPSVVPSAQNIPHMHFDEAAELAYFGSRVLHPSTLLPAMKERIPVRVLNTNRPEHHGTVIHERAPENPHPVTSIAYKENQCALTISSTRMFGETGFLAEVFASCAKNGVVVDLVTTSEVSISLTANKREPLERVAAELGKLGEVDLRTGRTVLAVVGQHLARRAGLGADILRAVAQAGVNVEMISYAAGSINLQMVIADGDVPRAVPVLHRTLFEG